MSSNWDWVGAKWWKFDFHNHTPASDDFGKGQNQATLKSIEPREWLLHYMRAEIDCVAVTDHNSGAWIDKLKTSIEELKDHSDYRPIYIFPGVEISANGNIHILAILPLSATTSDIDSLLGAVGYKGNKGSSDTCTERSACDVIDAIVNCNALAIAAHVDQVRGLFKELSGNTLEQVLNHNGLAAIEIVDSSYQKPQLYLDKKYSFPEVLGSDSHHPSGGNGQRFPGSNFTWVKMSEPSLEGLRLALIDGSLSLRRSDEESGNPNSQSSILIESVRINEAKYIGRGQPFTFKLNPWLNTIIGGRGTGKSTSLEFLRIVFDRIEELPTEFKRDFSKYREKSTSRNDDGLILEGTQISVYLRKNGQRFCLEWNAKTGERKIFEYLSQDDRREASGEIKQRFPLRIYSQKQIFEIAKNPQALLLVIDEACEVNSREWRLKWDELATEYLSMRAEVRAIETKLKEKSSIKGELEDVKLKLSVFEQAEHKDILRNYKRRSNQIQAIENWENKLEKFSNDIQVYLTSLKPPKLDPQYFMEDGSSESEQEVLSRSSEISEYLDKQVQQLVTISSEVETRWMSWVDERKTLSIQDEFDTANSEYKDLCEELSKVGANNAESYEPLVSRKRELEEKLEKILESENQIKKLNKDIDSILENIYAHRQEITQLREAFLATVLSNNQYVQISVLPYGDRENVEGDLRKLLELENGRFERDIGSLDDGEGLLGMLYDSERRINEDNIHELKQRVRDIHSSSDDDEHFCKDKRFLTSIRNLTPEKLDRLALWFPEDSLEVKFSITNKDDFKPVGQGSPGQKSAALLAFILSYGEEPLILDQPEDDLDNHLIYDLIVAQLREIKQQRQILIVTHNANIVVNGDAENVISLDNSSGRTRILSQGALQETDVRSQICRIMEGGHEAFDLRYKRLLRDLS